jgi:hypothetical protein
LQILALMVCRLVAESLRILAAMGPAMHQPRLVWVAPAQVPIDMNSAFQVPMKGLEETLPKQISHIFLDRAVQAQLIRTYVFGLATVNPWPWCCQVEPV